MKRSLSKARIEARRLFLTGELETNSEIAARVRVKPHTVGHWRRTEDWDDARRKIDRRAAEMFVEKIATDRVSLNLKHYKYWDVLFARLADEMKNPSSATAVRELERMATILARAQAGQRLAKGLSTAGETEEQIRAQAQAENRRLIDALIDALKQHEPDEEIRHRISQAVLEAMPQEPEVEEDAWS